LLLLIITNKVETQQLTHTTGPIVFGRSVSRDCAAKVVVRDSFVSREHLLIEETTDQKVVIENLSQRSRVAVDNHSLLEPGQKTEQYLPVRVGIGETVIDVSSVEVDPSEEARLRTVVAPRRMEETTEGPSLLAMGAAPQIEEMVGWLETVMDVLRASSGSQKFYEQTAKALVERIGLDVGLVLLHDGHAWRTAAKFSRKEQSVGRAYSYTILQKVFNEKRTFYLPSTAMGKAESLLGVESVVASPILNAEGEVIGAVYGTWKIRSRLREIGPIEAQVVQLLASAVGAGMARLKQDAEATRLRVAKEAAEAADRTKGQFLAMVSHELRTPLTTIIGYSEMLVEQCAADGQPQYLPDLQQIGKASHHLLTLINDILDLSKIEAGKMDLVVEPYSPTALLRDVVNSVEPVSRKNRNRVVSQIPDNLGDAKGDATRLRQCVLNLVSNACKFTADGVVAVEASRYTDNGADWLKVAVTDTGIGMSLEQMERLFVPFTQVDSTAGRKHGGTGLGLAISQKLCQSMGGGITAESAPGEGSVFTITVRADLSTMSSPNPNRPILPGG
jgi:signal transduction histidine kinase